MKPKKVFRLTTHTLVTISVDVIAENVTQAKEIASDRALDWAIQRPTKIHASNWNVTKQEGEK